MNRTNINITGNDHVFPYMIEYDVSKYESNDPISYTINDKRIDIFTDNIKYVKHENDWIKTDDWGEKHNIDINYYKVSKITLYFPIHSVDTYAKPYYALTTNTWINGKYVYLGTFIFDRSQALATQKITQSQSHSYYECIEFQIVDPRDIIYSDSWKEFRHEVCGEQLFGDDININNTGSQLNITLYPLKKIGDTYIMHDDWNGGQNSIDITIGIEDMMSLNISKFFDESGINIKCDTIFNNVYEGSLNEYIIETYGVENCKYNYELIVKDDNTIYTDKNGGILSKNIDNISCVFNRSDLKQYKIFDNWDNWRDGMSIVCSLNITKDDKDILYLISNEIPINMELFKYLVGEQKLFYINLKGVDMNCYNINAVNKIVNEVVYVDDQNDSKSNIIQPVFIRTKDVTNIIIHPEVTENICINLDAYKSKVSSFSIKIEGQIFNQIGMISKGVIFKIIGSKLPNIKKEGIYYILNEDAELITSGKYIYEI